MLSTYMSLSLIMVWVSFTMSCSRSGMPSPASGWVGLALGKEALQNALANMWMGGGWLEKEEAHQNALACVWMGGVWLDKGGRSGTPLPAPVDVWMKIPFWERREDRGGTESRGEMVEHPLKSTLSI